MSIAAPSLATKKGKELEQRRKTPAGILAMQAFFVAIAITAKLDHEKTLAGRVTNLRKTLIALRTYQDAHTLDSAMGTKVDTAVTNSIGSHASKEKDTLLSGIKNELTLALGVGISVITVTGTATAVILNQCFSLITNTQLDLVLGGVAAAALYTIVALVTGYCKVNEAMQIANNSLPKNHR